MILRKLSVCIPLAEFDYRDSQRKGSSETIIDRISSKALLIFQEIYFNVVRKGERADKIVLIKH